MDISVKPHLQKVLLPLILSFTFQLPDFVFVLLSHGRQRVELGEVIIVEKMTKKRKAGSAPSA